MCLFTHFAAGALAGGLTGNPFWGTVAGVASHALLDMLPHYDHPDWRVEIAGGGLSLLLLLLMPFATLPAVLGGLGGMLPDLENLFQKLGLYSRRRFVFPTHTGLLPHGRRLVPASLGWQAAIFVGCFLALGWVQGPRAAQAAEPAPQTVALGRSVVTVLQAGPDRTVLQLRIPLLRGPTDWQTVASAQIQWGDPLTMDDRAPAEERFGPPQLRFPLAVPTTMRPTLRVTNLSWWKEPAEGSGAVLPVRVTDPGIFRSVPLTQLLVEPGLGGGVLSSLTVEISHPRRGSYAEALDLGKAASGTVPSPVAVNSLLNADLWRDLSLGAARQAQAAAKAKPADTNLFGLTSHWLRLDVRAHGPVRVTGVELSNMGLATTDVDPAKLRLFRGGGLAVDIDPTLPDAQQADRIGLNEVAIEVRDGGDQEWNLDDELRFFAVGPDAWLDQFDDSADRLEFSNHPYSDHATYWLSWEGESTASPLPGPARRMFPSAALPAGDPEVSTGRVRLHREKQLLDTGGLFADNWAWDSFVYSSRQDTFTLRNPVAGTPARFVVDVRGNYYSLSNSYPFRAECWLNGDSGDKTVLEFTSRDQVKPDSLRVRVVGSSATLIDGLNTLTFANGSVETNIPKQSMSLDSFDISYLADLVLDQGRGPLSVIYNSAEPGFPGVDFTARLQIPGGGDVVAWDVSDPAAPRILGGARDSQDAEIHRFGYSLPDDRDHELVFLRNTGFGSVTSGSRVTPISLRSQPTDYDYLVVYPSQFALAATSLAGYRSAAIRGVESPAATAVRDQDIYDNFSGGQKDPLAIRNYLRYVYEQSGHRLRYVCFVGNASRDYRNFLDHPQEVGLWDFLPTVVRTVFPDYPTTGSSATPFASDDGLVAFDEPLVGTLDYPDLACGRLPVTTAGDALDIVSRIIAYDGNPAAGSWRNRVTFAADDADRPDFGGYPLTQETYHTREAEVLTELFLPTSLDVQKIYGVTYSFPSPSSNVKPQMRNDINAALNEGTTIFHYIGHGAEDNLADEQVFQSRDIPNLLNGMKRAVFVAFSCDVGVYDSPGRLSMAEQFLTNSSGGAIACITASQVSYGLLNDDLSEAFYAELFFDRKVDPERTLGMALMAAKADMTNDGSIRNSQHFSIMGDPALSFPQPAAVLGFGAGSPDSLLTGLRQKVVMAPDGENPPQAGESYNIRIEDSAIDEVYPVYQRFTNAEPPPTYIYVQVPRTYRKRGAAVFRGTGVVEGGSLQIAFINPAQFHYGDDARIRIIVDGTNGERAGVMRLSAVRGSGGTGNDLAGPDINLAFADGRYRVRAGSPLTAALTDSSGIAILGTSPGNSLLLEFDDSGFMTDVTSSFAFSANSYTTGSLSFPLPGDLDLGGHTAALHASDALGNVGSDTLSFQVIPEGVRGLENVTVFPNPTPGPCRLLVDLSDPMPVQWEIYTLAGKRIRTLRRDFASAGPVILAWDGRDDRGDEIANGTYLFVLRGLTASADEREITKTGKLVMMR